MRILIIEEALQSGGGHWPGYIGEVARGMRAAGDEVDILMSKNAAPELVDELQGIPYLSKNSWLDAASQGAMGGIRHNWVLRRELSRWFSSHEPYDWVCCLTVRLQHLLAMVLLGRSGSIPSITRFLLLFVQGFGVYAGANKPTVFSNNLSSRLARFCFRLVTPVVRSGRVILAAETRGMQDELQRFTQLPVQLFPHPVPAPIAQREEKPASCHSDVAGPGRTEIVIACPGFARHEKGNDLLQQAIKLMLSRPTGDFCRFVMQWPEAFQMPDGTFREPDSELLSDERVEFLNHLLDARSYETLLERSDFVVLPYRRKSYQQRLSRVAIEAASRGIPLVYTSDTWISEVAEIVGDGVAIQEETAEDIVEAIGVALARIEQLERCALRGMAKVQNYHSSENFRSRLITII